MLRTFLYVLLCRNHDTIFLQLLNFGHADPEKQAIYKKIHDLTQGTRFVLWALEEVRFEQHGSACRMWVPTEVTDQVLLHHPTRKGIGCLGAVQIQDGKFICHREEDRFMGKSSSISSSRYVMIVAILAVTLC